MDITARQEWDFDESVMPPTKSERIGHIRFLLDEEFGAYHDNMNMDDEDIVIEALTLLLKTLDKEQTPMTPADLKAWRLAHQMNQVQLAAALGVTPSTIVRWEREEGGTSIPAFLSLALEALARRIGRKRKRG